MREPIYICRFSGSRAVKAILHVREVPQTCVNLFVETLIGPNFSAEKRLECCPGPNQVQYRSSNFNSHSEGRLMNTKNALMGAIFASIALQANAENLFANLGIGSRTGMATKCMEMHSKAWCVWDAANKSQGMKDFRPEDVAGVFKQRQESGGVELGMAALSTQDFMRSKADLFGKGGSVGMFLLGSILKGGQPGVVGSNRVYGWMPIELANTPEEAGALLSKIIEDATKEVMKDRLGEAFEFDVGTYKIHKAYGWRISGDNCDQIECKLSIERSTRESDKQKGAKGKAPEWLGGYDAWIFDYYGGQSIFELTEDGNHVSPKYIPSLAKLMPDWAFLSMSSEDSRYPKKYNAGVPFPVIFNKGEMLIPVFPAIQTIALKEVQ